MFIVNSIKGNKNNLLVLLFLGILSIVLFAPIVSSQYYPNSGDYHYYLAAIVQAKMGITMGQFPLRVAPLEYHGFQYPEYQFYGPFVYTVAGLVYKFLSPSNPFIAFKITIWLSRVLGGFYFFRLIKMITTCEAAALLAAIVYMMAPYYLLGINDNGDITEGLAQGMVPIVLYYMFFNYLRNGTLSSYILLTVAWCVLLLSHLVTFVYTSLFLFILFGILFIRDSSKYKQLILIGITYLVSLLLAAWFLVPIMYLHSYLDIASKLADPFATNWLTPIATLLSLSAVNPLRPDYTFYASVGWPILLGVGISLYNIISRKPKNFLRNYSLLWPLLITFFIALFAAWSPVDFWKWLPSDIDIAQIPTRLLIQTTWLGAIIFSFAIVWVFQTSNTKSNFDSLDQFKIKVEQKYIFILCLFIVVLSSSWLVTSTVNVSVKDLVNNNPYMRYNDYLLDSKHIKFYDKYDKQQALLNSFIDDDGWLDLYETKIFSIDLLKNNSQLTIILKGNAPEDRKPLNLYVYINNQRSIYHINLGDFSVEIPIYKYLDLKGKNFSLSFAVDHYFIPSASDTRKLAVTLSAIAFSGNTDKAYMPVDRVNKNCTHSPHDLQLVCKLDSTFKSSTIQLPILYYPQMLTIKLNGQVVNDYFPTEEKDGLLLATIKVPAGIAHITAKFTGIKWANWVSAIMSILLICLFLVAIGIAYVNKRDNL